MSLGYTIQGRDALDGGTAGASLGGSLGIYIQGITTGGASSLSGTTSPDQSGATTAGPSGAGGGSDGVVGASTGASGLVPQNVPAALTSYLPQIAIVVIAGVLLHMLLKR